MLLHGFTTGSDPALGPVVRRCFGRIYQAIRELTGAPVDEVRDFLAMGMLLSVLGALNVIGPDPAPAEPWMEELVGGIEGLREAQLGPPAG